MALQKFNNLDLPKGFVFAKKFEVLSQLGRGWEGEVYSVREIRTGIERAAKVFFPHRNLRNKAAKSYARKLHRLRDCPILLKYMYQDQIRYRGVTLTYLISEYVEGETLHGFLARQKGRKLHPFQAIHLLHALASKVEEIHNFKEYHGDLHSENIILQRCGLSFEIKLIDLCQREGTLQDNIKLDVYDLIRIFHESVGGKRKYSEQPLVVKDICCGLKRSLIWKKYRNAGQLRVYLENMIW